MKKMNYRTLIGKKQSKVAKRLVALTESEVDELRMDFDWQCDHNATQARCFDSWMRHRGYHKDNDTLVWSSLTK